jgi:hypothetical protein
MVEAEEMEDGECGGGSEWWRCGENIGNIKYL